MVSLPNSYLTLHPISVLRTSGSIISGSLSLGYDVHHSKVEPLLIEAAETSGLTEPFVEIRELGNFAITYRVNGLLAEVTSLITARSNLNRRILDILHENEIEIVSPTVMDQRRLSSDQRLMPSEGDHGSTVDRSKPEEIVFDKAERSAQREQAMQSLKAEIKELESRIKASKGDDKTELGSLLGIKRKRLAVLENQQEE